MDSGFPQPRGVTIGVCMRLNVFNVTVLRGVTHRRGTTVSSECKLSMFPCSVLIVFVVSQHNSVNITSIYEYNIYRTHGLNETKLEKEAKRNFN